MSIVDRITAEITQTYGDAWGMFFSQTIREQLIKAAMFNLWQSRDYSDCKKTAAAVQAEFEAAEIELLAKLA